MAGVNFRDTYGFDPDDYDGTGGGLPGMLWRAMQQQGVVQPGAATSSGQAGGPPFYPGLHDIPGGLLGGLLALQAYQQPPTENNGPAPAVSQEPNFRQLVRVTRSAIDPSDRSDSLSGQPYGSSQGDVGPADTSTGVSSQYRMQASQPSGPVGVYEDRLGPSSGGDMPTKLAQIVIPGRLPLPWSVPTSPQPQIPMPTIPDWLQEAWTLLLRKGRGFGGGGRSRRRNDDDDWCMQRKSAEDDRCAQRYDDYAHRDFLAACQKRATERWDSCNRNGGRPSPSEPPEWGPDDEDVWINENR